MHSAPSVSYPVGRCRFAAVLLVLAWLGAAAALMAWVRLVPAPSWQLALAAAALMVAGLSAAGGWAVSARGTLAWNGATWDWQSAGDPVPGRVERMLDLQRWLLLRWSPESGSGLWLWVEARRDPPHWDALRRAVYSRARAEPPHTPPAKP